MQGKESLVPPFELVRQRLAENIREGKELRTLYRLALRAEQARQHQQQFDPAAAQQGEVPSL
jgi:hypothetical protein